MQAILDAIKKFFADAVSHMDWKKMLYDGVKGNVIPALRKAAKDNQTSIDDVMVDGLEHLVDAYLKPDAPAPVPPAA